MKNFLTDLVSRVFMLKSTAVLGIALAIALSACNSMQKSQITDEELAKDVSKQKIIPGSDFAVVSAAKRLKQECPAVLDNTWPVNLKLRFRQDEKRLFSMHYKLLEILIKENIVKPVLSKSKLSEDAILYSNIVKTDKPGVYCWVIRTLDPSSEASTWHTHLFFREVFAPQKLKTKRPASKE